MKSYKWNVNSLSNDLNKIKEIIENNKNKKEALNDLSLIISMLEMDNSFNDKQVQANLLKQAKNIFSSNQIEKEEIIHINKLDKLNSMHDFNVEIIKNIKRYKLRRNKRYKLERSNILEGVMWIENLFKEIDINYYNDFKIFLESGRVKIDNDLKVFDSSYLLRLKSINNNYSGIKYSNTLLNSDNILYCFFEDKMYKLNKDRDRSIFEESLDIFFYLLLSDMLKKHDYKVSYDMKYMINHNFKSGFETFQYITGAEDKIEYDSASNKYIFNRESSLYDSEMVSSLKKGISFDGINRYFRNMYSYLLGIYLYQNYQIDPEETLEITSNFINILGTIPDNEILDKLGIRKSDFTKCEYYDDFIFNCRDEYKTLKKNRRKNK